MRSFTSSIIVLSLLLIGMNANAGVIRSASSATATSEFGPAYSINNTIDQSGLFTGFTSGVTDFDTYMAGNPYHSLNAGTEWFAQSGVLSAQVTYDMGSVYNIDRLAFWAEDAWGVATFDVLYSVDGVGYTSFMSNLMPSDHAYSTDYFADIFDMGFDAQYIRFDLTQCNPDACSIGEVAFSTNDVQVSEAGSLALLSIGLLAFGFSRKRK